ncbi:FCS-Like Zinc finger 15-like [Andrographis paniculata]|uniref:FCS-Like Zinc finger 15-like n=1 Tax=Andrographis paniculata TaxID=175694 RepID=UPI0021E702AE|nr:FCS-Like Zinc finger 15-like [Andrographis paniculata]
MVSSTKSFPTVSSSTSAAGAAVRKEHEMVGLSVILETCNDQTDKRSPQIIRKGSMIKPPSPIPPSSIFSGFSRSRTPLNLSTCFLCKQKLLPEKDIYMYKGDKAFCSEDCRCRQIFMDEEEATSSTSGCTLEYNCSIASANASPPPSTSRACKGSRNRRNAFVF